MAAAGRKSGAGTAAEDANSSLAFSESMHVQDMSVGVVDYYSFARDRDVDRTSRRGWSANNSAPRANSASRGRTAATTSNTKDNAATMSSTASKSRHSGMDKAQAQLLYGDLHDGVVKTAQWSSGLRSSSRTPAGGAKRPLRI